MKPTTTDAPLLFSYFQQVFNGYITFIVFQQ
jgi:hypothetical protein